MRSYAPYLVGLAALLVGCQPPCKQLSKTLCDELPKQPKLCNIVEQECRKASVSGRRCRALLATWPEHGKQRLQAFSKRYKGFHSWVTRRYKMAKALQVLRQEEARFREFVQKLLGTHKARVSRRPAPRRRAKKKRKGKKIRKKK